MGIISSSHCVVVAPLPAARQAMALILLLLFFSFGSVDGFLLFEEILTRMAESLPCSNMADVLVPVLVLSITGDVKRNGRKGRRGKTDKTMIYLRSQRGKSPKY